MAKVLLIDNYDSFTYNLAHLFGELGAEVVVHRNDEITVDEAQRATTVGEGGAVEEHLEELGDGPVPPAQEAPHVRLLPDQFAGGAGAEDEVEVVGKGEQFGHVFAGKRAVRLGGRVDHLHHDQRLVVGLLEPPQLPPLRVLVQQRGADGAQVPVGAVAVDHDAADLGVALAGDLLDRQRVGRLDDLARHANAVHRVDAPAVRPHDRRPIVTMQAVRAPTARAGRACGGRCPTASASAATTAAWRSGR